jgi:hypothetical protein
MPDVIEADETEAEDDAYFRRLAAEILASCPKRAARPPGC